MEPLLHKETPYQLVTQLDARLLQLLTDGMFLQLPLKFLVQMLHTKKLNQFQPVIPLDAKRLQLLAALMFQALTQILEVELILSQEKESHGFMENRFIKEHLFLPVILLAAKKTPLLIHTTCQLLLLKFSVLVLHTKNLFLHVIQQVVKQHLKLQTGPICLAMLHTSMVQILSTV